jgi:8-oxo-dGTP pyrophosphatase MutT (NUDIX family)
MDTNIYCNNCGKKGHGYYQCRLPITSNGIIAIRKTQDANNIEYLMIRRRHTLGFIDLIRGKYIVENKFYLSNMIYQMTNSEKEMLKTISFDDMWLGIWGKDNHNHRSEKHVSRDKFMQLKMGVYSDDDGKYTLDELIDESTTKWEEQEWGFPKGRKNYNETDLDCSIREFNEETGLNLDKKNIVQNIAPFEEIFCGSNYKSYKHKYFLAFLDSKPLEIVDNFEISDIKWKPYLECISSIRPYNLEKKRMLSNIDILLKKSILIS